MKKNLKSPFLNHGNQDHLKIKINNLNPDQIQSQNSSHLKIGQDWQDQMALKNAAILKSIEALLDDALKKMTD